MRNCPECGSEDTEPDMGPATSYSHGDINSWRCNNCGYSGLMAENAPETSEDHKDDSETSSETSDLRDLLIVLSPIILIILGAIIARFLLI